MFYVKKLGFVPNCVCCLASSLLVTRSTLLALCNIANKFEYFTTKLNHLHCRNKYRKLSRFVCQIVIIYCVHFDNTLSHSPSSLCLLLI